MRDLVILLATRPAFAHGASENPTANTCTVHPYFINMQLFVQVLAVGFPDAQ